MKLWYAVREERRDDGPLRQFLKALVIGLVLLALLLALPFIVPGCCGWSLGPSKARMERQLRALPSGSSAAQAERLLVRSGFSVSRDENRHMLVATRRTRDCLFDEGLHVTIELNDSNQVINTQVDEYSIPP